MCNKFAFNAFTGDITNSLQGDGTQHTWPPKCNGGPTTSGSHVLQKPLTTQWAQCFLPLES